MDADDDVTNSSSGHSSASDHADVHRPRSQRDQRLHTSPARRGSGDAQFAARRASRFADPESVMDEHADEGDNVGVCCSIDYVDMIRDAFEVSICFLLFFFFLPV